MKNLSKITIIISLCLFCFQSITAQTVSTATLTQNENEEGIMFDFNAKQEIILKGIEIALEDVGQYNFNIYYRTGSYVGFESSALGWTLLANTGNINSSSAGNLINLPLGGATLSLPNGTTYAFYLENVLNGNDIAMNQDITTGLLATTNSIGSIFSGVAININDGSFSGVDEVDRTFIGTLLFDVPAPQTPIPTMGQWGLLIFSLLIMNLSIFYVQRRELI